MLIIRTQDPHKSVISFANILGIYFPLTARPDINNPAQSLNWWLQYPIDDKITNFPQEHGLIFILTNHQDGLNLVQWSIHLPFSDIK